MGTLKVARAEADRLIGEQIDAGKELIELCRLLPTEATFDAWSDRQTRWCKFASAVLKHAFNGSEPADEFANSMSRVVHVMGNDWRDWAREEYEDTRRGVVTLESLRERLVFAIEPDDSQPDKAKKAKSSADGPPVIFLVHGRDEGRRDTVARFLEKTGDGHELVILDEQAMKGRTLIEKFEDHAASARFAVVVLTGDDVGGPKVKEGPLLPRARQNVIFELGFFFGALNRANVAVLYDDDVETPSDVVGVGYISFAEDWRARLVRELRAADLDFSMDRLDE